MIMNKIIILFGRVKTYVKKEGEGENSLHFVIEYGNFKSVFEIR